MIETAEILENDNPTDDMCGYSVLLALFGFGEYPYWIEREVESNGRR